ncbi:phosphopantetheine-binding protein [Streptomyces sp. NPDC048508]|uniref:phosphopantetheine-binding protein n=1 Tax=Streptomyces sp. NPDC048508 TaxID=3365561 RepID=UPI00371BF5D9
MSNELTEDQIQTRVFALIEEAGPWKPPDALTPLRDLGIDSLSVMDLLSAVEKDFSFRIPDEDVNRFANAQDIISYVKNRRF